MELNIQVSFSIEAENGFKVHPKIIELLKEIEVTGSLNSAVNNIGMSYSYAWNMLHKANCKLESPLIISKKGGNGGGVAKLTPTGHKLLDHCIRLEKDFKHFISNHSIEI